jgi:hypothetical protein
MPPYIKLDERFYSNKKIRKAWKQCKASVGLYVMALAYSKQWALDGRVDDDFVSQQCHGHVKARATAALLDAKLWSRDCHGYVIHDYLDWQESSNKVAAKSAKAREAGRLGGLAKAKRLARGVASETLEPHARARVSVVDVKGVKEVKDLKDLNLNVSDFKKPVETKKPDPEIARLCDLLAELIVSNDPKAKPQPQSARWLKEMRLLVRKDRGGDLDEVERVLRWSQHDSFWQSNILSPAKLRKQFSALAIQSQRPRTNGAPVSETVAKGDALIREMLKGRDL